MPSHMHKRTEIVASADTLILFTYSNLAWPLIIEATTRLMNENTRTGA